MPEGFHFSIAGGYEKAVDRAVELGCDALQFFGRNPRSWAEKTLTKAEIAAFRKRRDEANIWPVVAHTAYLVNLCTPDDALFAKSLKLFENELAIAQGLGADYLVTHMGSPLGKGAEYALERFTEALGNVADDCPWLDMEILLENTAGGGYSFGNRLEHIGMVVEAAAKLGIKAGLCFDTCHAFASGYPMQTKGEAKALAKEIKKHLGARGLKVIHLNDSKGVFASGLDRHEHIGKGKIGLEGFRALLSEPFFSKIPLIMETPKKKAGDDLMNLKVVRGLRSTGQ